VRVRLDTILAVSSVGFSKYGLFVMRRPATRGTIEPKRHGVPRRGAELQEKKDFESLLDELSAAMALAPADAVDGEVDAWLGKISQALDLDRSAIYERDAQDERVRTTHTWLRPGFPPFPPNYDPEKLFQRSTQLVMAGKTLTFARPSDIPAENKDARRFVERYGPKASAAIPMWAGGKIIGGATFGKFRAPREWSPELLARLALAVRLFGSAIERKQYEIALRTARTELRTASRRSTVGELTASIARELNRPLGAIMSNLGGLARLLSQGNPQPGVAAAAVANAIEDTKRAGEIVRRFHRMSKANDARKKAIDILLLVKEVGELTGGEASSREVTLRIDGSPKLPLVLVDRLQIQQCVLNLLMNALDATAQNKSGSREVTIGFAQNKTGWIEVSMSDTGTGIDPSIAKKIFEPFVTTKNKGMGLGLLVTRSIVEDHGGRVWFTPNPGSGTTFTFTLPVARTERVRGSRRG
jgi:signal transduction histidine kinase